ncbi:DUF4378 domain-containing protein/VARLMGL domain-containing protein [Cephalotus follicularis]|uniref:DUF4378 domain-containing protein/VARLMGL domain-containing protein n=1 Tax=Cephalotus follicularis TaxID=3775 RepID=A0A1Q3D613_CEPFO|nr:DUF4378 domain-containing protein/VARLMGL domain-containing protein [Cephalotus follicularis]
MGVEKEGSKNGGGYVGGLLQLFDWTAKSRKKLFSSKSDLPGTSEFQLNEQSKQGKKREGNLPIARPHLVDDYEIGAGSTIKGSGDYSCASSVTDDDGYGARGPGVVARLMGLESLPTSNFLESYSTPYFDTHSLSDGHYRRKNLDYQHDPQFMYSGNLLNKVDGPTRNFVESKQQKVQSRPIEKFQTEVLPPKSAKSIPSTHHKLLSPIKCHGYITSKNAAHIMEAAARIIEASPQAVTKAKMPVLGSSSAPLKVRDLKEKMEAALRMPPVGPSVPLKVQELKEKVEAAPRTSRLTEASRRPFESNAEKYLKGQSLNKSWNGSTDTSVSYSPDNEEGSSGLKNKGKSISLAIQAKVNVQRREASSSSSSRSLVGQKEHNEVKSGQPFRSQPNVQKNPNKKSYVHNSSGVLRQNNQKQNCQIDKEKLPSKPSVSHLQGRKVLPGDSSSGRQKSSGKIVGNSKTGSRKLGLDVMDSEKGVPYSSTRNFPRKKRSIDRDVDLKKNQDADSIMICENQKAFQSNPVIDRHFCWTEDSKKKGTAVVSFTFTTPLTRTMPGSDACQAAHENSGKSLLLDTEAMKLSSLGYNFLGADALSMLLEQKLRELTHGAESSCNDAFKVESASRPSLHAVSNTLGVYDKRDQHVLPAGKSNSHCDSSFYSTDSPALRFKFPGLDEMECSSNNVDIKQSLDCRHPSPVSILEPSFSTESYIASDSTENSSMEGDKHFSSVKAQEVPALSSLKKFHYADVDIELSDSASSTATATVAGNHGSTLIVTDLARSNNWELDYVKDILCNVELMLENFLLGRAREIINPHLFDQLESRQGGFVCDEESRLRRKVLFDCVSECLDLRCRRHVGGGYRTWVKGVATLTRNARLAEEIHKEISGWQVMGDSMVDELVDKDMSSQYGRWLDFEVDAFLLGVEIEGQIFNSLFDDVIAGIF